MTTLLRSIALGSQLIVLSMQTGCSPASEPAQIVAPAYEQTLNSDDYEILLRAEPLDMTVADRLTITLIARSDAGQIREISVEPTDADEWIIREPKTVTDRGDGEPSIQLVLEAYLPGEFATPAFRITPTFADGSRGDTIQSEPFLVNVTSVLGNDDGQMAGTKGVVHPPAPPWWRRPLVIGAIVLGLLILATSLLARRLLSRILPEEESLPSDQQALARLDELSRSGLLHRDSMDRFYFELSEILRWYIEHRYAINAPDHTTEEFLEMARHAPELCSVDLELLERFMTHSDRVKFAKERVDVEQGQRSLETVRSFIQRSGSSSSAATPEMTA